MFRNLELKGKSLEKNLNSSRITRITKFTNIDKMYFLFQKHKREINDLVRPVSLK